MKILRIFLLVISVSVLTDCFGQLPDGFTKVNDIVDFKKKVEETSKLTNSISSNFRQEKHLTMMEEVLLSNGKFLFEKKNKVRWEYFEPIKYAIIINENRFIIDNDGKISEFDTESNKLFKEINNMIVMAIRGNFVDNPDFKAGFYEQNETYLAVLKPRNELLEGILSAIEIYFQKSDMAVTKVKFIEPGEDYTTIIFSDRKVNIEINNELFNAK